MDNKLSNTNQRGCRSRRRGSVQPRFKISVIAELESGKSPAQKPASRAFILVFPRWKDELAENPEKAFSINKNRYKYEARITDLERLLG